MDDLALFPVDAVAATTWAVVQRTTDEASSALLDRPSTPARANPAELLRHTCRCGARWAGVATCHCAAEGCHLTLATVRAYTTHRRNGHCLKPAALGMTLIPGRSYPVWGYLTEPQGEDS